MNLSQDESNSMTQQNSGPLQNSILRLKLELKQEPEPKKDSSQYDSMPFTLLVPKQEIMEEIVMQTQNYSHDEKRTEVFIKQENPEPLQSDPEQGIPIIEKVSFAE